LVALFTASLMWAAGRAQPQRAFAAPTASRALLLLGPPLAVLGLYVALGNPRALNPDEVQPNPDEAAQTMVLRLQQRLAQTPGDTAGWLMLGRSLKVLGRLPEAVAAYERAGAAAQADPDVLVDWVEARILLDEQRFDATSRQLLAQAMGLAPDHPGVLLLRGLAALDRGDWAAGRQALVQLRAQHAEGSPDHQALGQAIAGLDAGRDPRAHR
jgi:cytochrome c-type biogenesis protein CcmH